MTTAPSSVGTVLGKDVRAAQGGWGRLHRRDPGAHHPLSVASHRTDGGEGLVVLCKRLRREMARSGVGGGRCCDVSPVAHR